MIDARLEKLFPPKSSLRESTADEHFKSEMISSCVAALTKDRREEESESSVSYFVPGRIELLGKHTDYCGGRSLICAVDLGFVFIARPRSDHTIRMIDVSSGEIEAPSATSTALG